MIYEREILQSLQTAALAAVAASTVSALPVKAVGRNGPDTTDQKFIEFVHIPNNVLGQYWGNEQTYRGLFRIILHWPVDDQGAYPPLDALASVASYFTKGKMLENDVKIYENPQCSSTIEAGKENLFVVTLWYQRFAQ